jgi:uncharacterized phage protein gp47/JayE
MTDLAAKTQAQILQEMNDDVANTMPGARVRGPGDDFYDLNAAASGALAEAHANLAAAADESMDDSCSLANLVKRNRHRIGDPTAATPARLTITITGLVGAGWLTTDTLVHATSGQRYAPLAAGVIPAGGTTTTIVQAIVGGQAGALASGETLYWETHPVGIDATATTTGDPVGGSDAESEAEYRDRVFDWYQHPEGGGTAHDFERWAREVTGIGYAIAFVARRALGTIDVAVLDHEGDNVTAGVLADVQDYLDDKRPAGCAESLAVPPTLTTLAVHRRLTMADGYEFSSFAAKTTAAGCTTTQLVLNNTAGLEEDDWIAVKVVVNGQTRFEARQITSVESGTRVNVAPAFSAAPAAVLAARPGCPTFDQLALSVVNYFETLRIGGTFYNTACGRFLAENAEVLNNTAVLPAADTAPTLSPATIESFVLGDLHLEPV